MNGKRARRLRRQAEAATVGQLDRHLVETTQSRTIPYTAFYDEQGKPVIRRFKPTNTLAHSAVTTRRAYQDLKRTGGRP